MRIPCFLKSFFMPVGKRNRPWTMDYGPWTLVLMIVIMTMPGCAKKKAAAGAEPVPVRVMEVRRQGISRTLDYGGDIKAGDEAMVYPRVGGKVVEKIREEGSMVNKGDVLVYLDRDEVGLKFERVPVESPLAGVVGRIYVDRGTQVGPQTPVALVVDMDTVKVELGIPEKYLPAVSPGQNAEIIVDAYPGEKFTGTIVRFAPVVDLATRTAQAEILIANTGHRLKPGMFCRVQLTIENHDNVPVVLKEAVLGEEPEAYVYVVESGVARKRKVTPGIRRGSDLEITEGLQGGERVVIMGQQRLLDGAAVKAEEAEN